MKLNVQPRILSLLPLTAGLVFAAAMPQGWASNSLQAGAVDLALVKSTFQKLDADGNGSVTAAESKKARISSLLFDRHDVDKSQSLSADEFVVLYKDLLVQVKRPVAKDLASEVTRIQARRRALEKESEAKAEQKKVEAKKAEADGAKAVKKVEPKVAPSDAGADLPPATKAASPVAVGKLQGAKGIEPVAVPAQDAGATGSNAGATADEIAKRIEEARKKQADLDEQRIREARIKAAESAEARTKAGRIKAAEAAEARTKAARIKAAESAEARTKAGRIKAAESAEARTKAARMREAETSAEARILAARQEAARQSAEARTKAAREKAALEAASDGGKQTPGGKPGALKGERVPAGKVKSAKRGVQSVTRHTVKGQPADATPVTTGSTGSAGKPAGAPPAGNPAGTKPTGQPSPVPAPAPKPAPAGKPVSKPGGDADKSNAKDDQAKPATRGDKNGR